MDITQAVQAASQDPRFQEAIAAARAELSDVSPEQVTELIEMLEFALQNPQAYPEVRAAAIADDMVDETDLPEQFNAELLSAVLVVLYGLRDGGGAMQSGMMPPPEMGMPAEIPPEMGMQPPQMMMARGGLADLARMGRNGDTMLAHITPREAEILRMRGGAGTINPITGMPEFFLKKLFKAVLPFAINFIAPGLGTAIGTALGATGATAAALGSAVIGGVSSGLTGGNVLQGALMGGLGGGLGGVTGGAVSNALGLGLGPMGQSILGSGLLGAGAGLATGQGALKGALQGVAGGALGQMAGGMPGDTAFQQALKSGIGTFGQGITAGYDPKTAAGMGALTGLAAGIQYKPSQAAVDAAKNGKSEPSFFERALSGGPLDSTKTGTTEGGSSFGTLGNLAMAGSVLSGLAGAPPEVKQAVSALSPSQQEYFNRPTVQWDWNQMQKDASASGMSLSQYMAQNWDKVSRGQYAMGQPEVAMAMGGPLAQVARFARGAGSGRDDTINARLSDGEYVMDAETVAMLGDGSSKEGARRLDQMRESLRSHKGKALAKGKFSPDAKSPLEYIKGMAS
jgi:hypothetical protein